MKKALAMVIALSFCLIACACGETAPSEAELAMQAEQAAFEEANALLTAEQYEEAIEAFSAIESYKKVADKIAEASAKKEEAERLAAEAAEAARPRKTIEITMDNWQEYFEIAEANYLDSFGELEGLLYILRPIEAIQDKIDYSSSFSIDVKFKDIFSGDYSYEYDPDTNTLTILNATFIANSEHIYTSSYTSLDLQDTVNIGYDGPYTDNKFPHTLLSMAPISHQPDVHLLSMTEVTIEDIKGSIVVFA